MADFQLILLSEVNRPLREARESGAFSLIQFRTTEVAMASPQRQLAAEDIVDWLTPSQAIEILFEVYGDNYLCKDTLLGRLRSGLVEAVAENTVVHGGGISRYAMHRVYREEWQRIDARDNGWITGDFRYERRQQSGIDFETVNNLSVKFEPQGVRDIIKNATPKPTRSKWIKPNKPEPAPSPISPPVPLQENKGGRPRKEWWDDFWIEICRQIWIGDLQPKTQADLERAMIEWVENHRKGEVGETTIKAAAKKLFKAWSLGSKT